MILHFCSKNLRRDSPLFCFIPVPVDKRVEAFLGQWPQLRTWYRKGARDLPWRRDPVDPYKVWISEMMSQQSTMATVVPYFHKWMKRFPNIEDLAKASEAEVLELWAGLGYYSRARNVRAAAIEILEGREQGRWQFWPSNTEQWESLKGVGPYTAAAVLSIGLGKKALPADGNVYRVGARFFGVPDPLNSGKDKRKIAELFQKALASSKIRQASVFSQSLMELGALLCKPGAQALCELCPLAPACKSQGEAAAELPKVKRRRAMLDVFELVDLSNWDGGFMRISEGKRLAGQWEIPRKTLSKKEYECIKPSFDFELRHSITHHKYRVGVVGASRGYRAPKVLKGQVLTTLTRKILEKCESSRCWR